MGETEEILFFMFTSLKVDVDSLLFMGLVLSLYLYIQFCNALRNRNELNIKKLFPLWYLPAFWHPKIISDCYYGSAGIDSIHFWHFRRMKERTPFLGL